MAATQQTINWDAAWTLSGKEHRKRLTDNISDSYPTLKAFRKSGVMETMKGGVVIEEDVMYALADTQWFDGYDDIDTDSVDGITKAQYYTRYNATPTVISMTEEEESRTAESGQSLMQAKMTQAMTGAFDANNAALLGATTGKKILGIQDIVSKTAGSTVGGIDSSAETWWDNTRVDYDTGYAGTKFRVNETDTSIPNGVCAMGDLWRAVSEGNDTPNLIITSYEIGGQYESLFEGGTYLRLKPSDSNDLDGSGATFRGATMIQDRDCAYTSTTEGYMYMLNTKYLKYKVASNKNFAKTPYKEGPRQFAKVGFVVHGSQLVTNHRARQGVLFDIES